MPNNIYIMKKIIFILIFSILFNCGKKKPYSNKISDFRPELQIHLNKLKKDKYIYTTDSIATKYLNENCTKEELLQLLESEIPLLRVIAYRTLIKRKNNDYFKILLGHLNDTAKVPWSEGDLQGETMVSDLLISEAITIGKLTQSKKNTLVDSVLTKHLYLESSKSMMIEMNPQEKYYSLIKKQTITVKHPDLSDECKKLTFTYSLSKFKKEKDLEYIKNNFKKFTILPGCNDYIFKSIEENPNNIYFPILEKYFYEIIKKKKQYTAEDLKYYCRAIAKYQNKESLALLTEILDKKNYPDTLYFRFNKDNVFRAIHKYKSPIYEDLYKKMKPKMSEYVMEYLDMPDYNERKTW